METALGIILLALFFITPISVYFTVKRKYQRTASSRGGLTRGMYFLSAIVIGFIVLLVVSFAAEELPQDVAQIVVLAAPIIYFIPIRYRLINIGFSPHWAYLAIIPVVNFWLGLLALFCPPLELKNPTARNKTRGGKSKKREDASSGETGSLINLRISSKGIELGSLDEASIRLKIMTGDLTKDDLYWDASIHDWVPLYCHPNFSDGSNA